MKDNTNELFSADKAKKTIVFYNNISTTFDGNELDKRPVGGAETCIINLSKCLAKDYNVFVINYCENPGIYDGVKYVHTNDTDFLKNIKTDLFVALRIPPLLNFKEMYDIDKLVLWAHDFAECPCWEILPEAIDNIDKIVALTDWHKNNIQNRFPWLEDDKFVIIGNGIDKNLFNLESTPTPAERFKANKLIYSSTPFRGLDILLDAFPLIREEIPNAELHICSSMKVYGKSDAEEEPYKAMYEKAKNMEGVVYHGSIKQKELAKLMKQMTLMAYPNQYRETFFIGGAETLACGAPIITTNLGALPETIPQDCSIMLPECDRDPYTILFTEAVVDTLKDKRRYMKLYKALQNIPDIRWENRTKEWINAFLKDADEEYLNHLATRVGIQEYKESHGGNANTKEYWDKKHRYELKKGIEYIDLEKFKLLAFNISNNSSILDYGCGRGEFIHYLIEDKKNCKLYCFDISKVALDKIAFGIVPKNGNETITSLSFKTLKKRLEEDGEKQFDTIVCQHLLEHLDNPEEILEMFFDNVNPTGEIALVLPYNDEYWPEHQKIYTEEDIHNLIEKASKSYPCEYDMHIREGRYGEEAVIFIRFDGRID